MAAAALGMEAHGGAAGGDLDVRWLQKKLEMVTEWHERAEDMLAKQNGMPNQTRRLKHFTDNPDIAIPLLQSYDDAILENQETIADLKRQLAEARGVAEQASHDGRTATATARSAEERANLAVEESNVRLQGALNETAQLKGVISQQQQELQEARDAASNLVTKESNYHHTVQRLEGQLLERDQAIATLKKDQETMHQKLEQALSKLRTSQVTEDEGRNDTEATKIQLHLVTKENDDKVHEIERLRNKMVTALKQSADNHATHLRLVEDKHRSIVQNLQEQNRTQEVTIVKLRAQLAHADVAASGKLTVPAAAEVVATQARQAQEAELRRLHAEVTALQMQRDDALFKVEQSMAQQRADTDSKLLEARRDNELLRSRNAELEDRNARLVEEANTSRDQLRSVRDASRSQIADQAHHTQELDNVQKKLAEARKAQQRAEDELDRATRAHHDAVEAERKKLRAAERRVDDARRGEQQLRDRQAAEMTEVQRELDSTRQQAREATSRQQLLQTQLYEKERATDASSVKVERLTQGLNAHKQQLAGCDERLRRATGENETLRDEVRKLALQVEHVRMENNRLVHERDRVRQDAVAMKAALGR